MLPSGASIVVQWVKPTLAELESHIRSPVSVPSAPLPIWVPINALGKEAEYGSSMEGPTT